MSYIIRKTNGTTLGTILDGTIDTAQTSLTLVGRNYSNYGQIMTDNLVALVENFAYGTAPSNPLPGQLWWDTTNNLLKVYADTAFKVVGSALATAIAPVTTLAGDLWWDTTNEQFYIYNGTSPYASSGWTLVGPVWGKVAGKSGALRETIVDIAAVTHTVIVLYLDGVRTAIISRDNEFTPSATLSGFTTILPGHNMASFGTFAGTATNASQLGGVAASHYLRTDINNSSTGSLSVVNDNGITVGVDADLTLSVSGSDVAITNNSNAGDIGLYTNNTRYLYINGADGVVEVASAPTTTMGVATKGYVDDSFTDSVLSGTPTAPTPSYGTANTQIATTAFVVNNSGFLKNKIYEGNSYLEILDAGTGSVTLAVDGVTVMSASVSGVNLHSNSIANTQTQTYTSTGDNKVATTSYVRTATQWWGGSAKFVSTDAPDAGQGNDGDFWFQYTV
jgi:hypothetical protein